MRTVHFVTLALAFLLSSTARADMVFDTDVPTANSSRDMPLRLRIYNRAGNFITVNVTTIRAGMTPAAKAEEIRNAIPAGFQPGRFNNEVKIRNTNRVVIGPDPTGEELDKAKFSDRYLGSLQGTGDPTGLDSMGSSSLVQFGVEGSWVAMVHPTSAMTLSDVLNSLAEDLTRHGVPAMFDEPNHSVNLLGPVAADTFVDFGSTDTGLHIGTDLAAVPEPASLILLGVGALGLLGKRLAGRSRSLPPGGSAAGTA